MGFQIAYLAPELTKKYGLALNVIAGVIYVLSDKGTREIIASEPFLSERTGLSVRMISKAKGILSKEGFLKTRTFNKGLTRVTTLIPTSKLVEVFNLPDHAQHALSTTHNMHDRTSTACVTITHSVRDGSCTECTNDHALHACKNNKENNTGNNIESNSSDAREKNDDHGQMSENDIHDFLTIPFADDDDFEDHELKNDIAEQSEPTPLKSNSPQAEEKKNSAKRKERKPRAVIEYPKNAAEVLKLMQAWKEKHISVEPRIQGVNLELESEKFFDYWEEHNWTNKRGKIKSMNSTVATWLGFAIDNVKGNYTAPAPVPAPENDRPKISVFDAVERGLCKNLDEASALANADGWIFEDQLKNVVDAEFEIVEDEPLALKR